MWWCHSSLWQVKWHHGLECVYFIYFFRLTFYAMRRNDIQELEPFYLKAHVQHVDDMPGLFITLNWLWKESGLYVTYRHLPCKKRPLSLALLNVGVSVHVSVCDMHRSPSIVLKGLGLCSLKTDVQWQFRCPRRKSCLVFSSRIKKTHVCHRSYIIVCPMRAEVLKVLGHLNCHCLCFGTIYCVCSNREHLLPCTESRHVLL